MPKIAHLTRGKFKELINQNSVVIIPVGAVEQHGPQCPLGTDALTAEALAQEACQRSNTLVTPTVFIGLSQHHKEFAGTLWVSFNSFFNYLFDIAQALVYQGATKLIFVNGHGGNNALLDTLCADIKYRLNILALVFTWWIPDTDIQKIFAKGGGHADDVETSMIASIHPELVDMEEFNKLDPDKIPAKWGQSLEEVNIPLYTHEFSETGIAGTIDNFSIEKGQEIKEASIQRLVKIITGLKNYKK